MDETTFERVVANLSAMIAQQAQQIAALQSFIQGLAAEAPDEEQVSVPQEPEVVTD